MHADRSGENDGRETALDDDRVLSLTQSMVAGDRRAYAALFEARCAFVESAAVSSLRTRRDLVQDAAQDAWLRIARRPVACSSVAGLDAWLRRVVTSAAIDLVRSELSRRVREQHTARSRREAAEFIDGAAVLAAIRGDLAALEALDREDHALLELRARVDRSVAVIAGMLGIGSAALESRLRRATARAQRLMDGDGVST